MENKYGLLLNGDIRLHRSYFVEMTKLLGIQVIYKAPLSDKHYDLYGNIESNYDDGKLVGVIFDEHPTQQTLKKLGWVSELQDRSSIIHVPYDLEGLQQGALFIVPSGLDDGKGRVFRVVKITTGIVYPASITCEIIPEYENSFNKAAAEDYHDASMTLLNHEDDVMFNER